MTSVMNQRPIVFSGESVRAILASNKSQTRRVMAPQPVFTQHNAHGHPWLGWTHGRRIGSGKDISAFAAHARHRCPFGQVGDVLWVRETFTADLHYPMPGDRSALKWMHEVPPAFRVGPNMERIYYAADQTHYMAQMVVERDEYAGMSSSPIKPGEMKGARWTSPRYMPRWACRLTLELTEIRAQPLHEITEEDAVAEGADLARFRTAVPVRAAGYLGSSECYRAGYACTWDTLNKARGYGWSENPWVWALTFKLASDAIA